MTKIVLVSCLLGVGCASDQAAHPVISRATVRIDVANEAAPPQVDVAITLVGGDEAHTAVLESVYLGTVFDQERTLDLHFPTATVAMEPRSQFLIPLVGELARADFIDHCQSTRPIGASLTFEDTADLVAFSPLGQLAVFCD